MEDDEDWVRESASEEEEEESSERPRSRTLTSSSTGRSWDCDSRPHTPRGNMMEDCWEKEDREKAEWEEEDAHGGYGSGEDANNFWSRLENDE